MGKRDHFSKTITECKQCCISFNTLELIKNSKLEEKENHH